MCILKRLSVPGKTNDKTITLNPILSKIAKHIITEIKGEFHVFTHEKDNSDQNQTVELQNGMLKDSGTKSKSILKVRNCDKIYIVAQYVVS